MPKKEVLNHNNDQYSEGIMLAVEEILGESKYQNKHILNRLYTPNELFDSVLEYEGFIGYGSKLREYIREIYGIDLNKVEV